MNKLGQVNHLIDSQSQAQLVQATQRKDYNGHSVEYKKITDKLDKRLYVPLQVLQKYGLEDRFTSVKSATADSLKNKSSPFGSAKFNTSENVSNINPKESTRLFPEKSLTRLMTSVPSEWLQGFGIMKKEELSEAEKQIPEEQKMAHDIVGSNKVKPSISQWGDYTDTFVSDLVEYEKKGIHFDPSSKNDPLAMATKLALKEDDLQKIEKEGAWLLLISPGVSVAAPSGRLSEANPGYVEGGYTADGNREWVTPNKPLEPEMRAGRAKIFKMDSEGNTIEWKFFRGKLLPNSPKGADGRSPEGSWSRTIEEYSNKVAANRLNLY